MTEPGRAMKVYTPEQRTEAVARATVVGDKQAARELGIPRRTVSYWHSDPKYAAIAAEAAGDLVDIYAEAERLALQRVMDGLPTASVAHAARALEVVSNVRALLAGQATAINQNMNLNAQVEEPLLTPQENEALHQFLRAVANQRDDDV